MSRMSKYQENYRTIWEGINAGIKTLCEENEFLLLRSVMETVQDPNEPDRILEEFTSDGAHFNHTGYEKLGRAMADELSTTLKAGDAVALFGDSITAGYPYYEPVLSPGSGDPTHSYGHWLERMIGVLIYNNGISGDTTSGILRRLRDFDKDCEYVILQGGANDVINTLMRESNERIIGTVLANLEDMGRAALYLEMKPIYMPLLPFKVDW